MKEELENKLNNEYKLLGEITIREMHEETISTKEIDFIKPIMNIVEPIESDEPIVISKTWRGYKLIDGYHRLKNKVLKKESIDAYVLDSYSIKRKSDSLLQFVQGLTGKTITFLDSETLKVNEDTYYIKSNEGCGGCSSGWSSIDLMSDFKGKKMKVNSVKEVSKDKYSDLYDLVINDNLVAKIDTGWGNGYYGGDFEIKLIK